MSNINKQLRTDLLIANALETAKQLRELQESPVAEAIFESIVENENGKEIQFERPISDLAFAAFWQLEKLVTALGAAEKRIAELEAREVVLPPTFWYEHDDLSRDVPVLDKRLVKKAIRAAGISIKGE